MNIRLFAAACFLLILMNCWAYAQDSSTQYILLKNDSVIEGIVETENSTHEHLVIRKNSGSQIYLPRKRVESVANTLNEVYWAKCATLSATDPNGHTSLFRWCMDRELLEEAQNQIDLLSLMKTKATTLMKLSDQLDAASAAWRAKLDAQKYATKQLPLSKPRNQSGNKQRDEEVGQVLQVGYEAPVEIADRLKLIERLEQATDSIHGEAVVMFKRKVEPMLINSCYTAKCHSNDSMPLPLATLSKSQRIPKRMSQRNLYNVLKFTDFDRPMESKLLAAAALPHAGNPEPIIKLNSPQFQTLRVWLIGISSKPFLYHSVPENFYASDLEVQVDGDTKQEASSPDVAPVLHSIKKIPSNSNNKSESGDPFDPEVFNRLYVKPKEEDSGEEAAKAETGKEETAKADKNVDNDQG